MVYMTKRMLIDTSHPEETRVAVVEGKKLLDLDFDSIAQRQVKGNIYLAKVMRVEPSLQAAFVDYGGNRHGFLPFGEIHPDYFRIPIADREALLAEEAVEAEVETQEDEEMEASAVVAPMESADILAPEEGSVDADAPTEENVPRPTRETEEEDFHRPRRIGKRRYKIQEVIKKRQILLVQVTKEERGNKGAALTTYLSLAGRYCILMPNNPNGGGISRKIDNAADRRRIREIIDDLEVPAGVSVIVRTAGLGRTRPEIKRDYEYLLRLWDDIRGRTLEATAPTLIYEEGNLIKRALRDNYQRDIDHIVVDGEAGFREARDLMKMLMPSHVKRIQLHEDSIPLFQAAGIESEIDAILRSNVTLPSGGYIVINQTEALVAIDVNSGRAIRERNIEETAFKTNLEAADEIARQVRLRDLAGLIVVDFIDMSDRRNNVTVEKRFKDAVRFDRARLQIGRISSFGLLEMSRQRLRPSLTEASTLVCPSCHGSGRVRSPESIALHVLRVLHDEGAKKTGVYKVRLPMLVALYIINNKRSILSAVEQQANIKVIFENKEDLPPPGFVVTREADRVEIDDKEENTAKPLHRSRVIELNEDDADNAHEVDENIDAQESAEPGEDVPTPAGDGQKPRRRRRGGRRGRRSEEANAGTQPFPTIKDNHNDDGVEADESLAEPHQNAENQIKKPDVHETERPRRRGLFRRDRSEKNDRRRSESVERPVVAVVQEPAIQILTPLPEVAPVPRDPIPLGPSVGEVKTVTDAPVNGGRRGWWSKTK
jgi:ribonuclease E